MPAFRHMYSALNRLSGVSTSLRGSLLTLGREFVEGLPGSARSVGLPAALARALGALPWDSCFSEDEALERRGVRIVAYPEEGFPAALREIPDPPPALFCLGEVRCLEAPTVAVVGSRLSTVYGQNVARMLGEDLALLGITVVSGLARGIDACAHEGSLAASGRAAAVLATGIDRVYPREHLGLASRIEGAGGVVLTEAPPGTPPLPGRFPVRNRIIAGLAWGVVVVEAAERSGSLITARLALEAGREVFAVPHNITSRTGIGPNILIRSGAHLILRVSDILEEMPPYLRGRLGAPPPGQPARTAPFPPAAPGANPVLALLRPDVPATLDELTEASGLDVPKLLALLLELQMAGLCVELPGGRYALSSKRTSRP